MKKSRITNVKSNIPILIFLSLYIIGVVFSVVLSFDTNTYGDSVRSGVEYINEGNKLNVIFRLILSFFSVSIVLWSCCLMVSAFRLISVTALFVSLFLGYSSGLSSFILLRSYSVNAMWYILICIVPIAVVRFFIWYAYYIIGRNFKYYKRKDINKHLVPIKILIVILLWDVASAVMVTVFTDVFF